MKKELLCSINNSGMAEHADTLLWPAATQSEVDTKVAIVTSILTDEVGRAVDPRVQGKVPMVEQRDPAGQNPRKCMSPEVPALPPPTSKDYSQKKVPRHET